MGQKRSKGYASRKAYELLMYDRGLIKDKPSLPKSRSLRGSIQSRYNRLKKEMKSKPFGDVLPKDKTIKKKVQSLINKKLDKKVRYGVEYQILYVFPEGKEWSSKEYYSGSEVMEIPEVLLNLISDLKKRLSVLQTDEQDISESPELGIPDTKIIREDMVLLFEILDHYYTEINNNYSIKRSVTEWNRLLDKWRREYIENNPWDDIKFKVFQIKYYK